MNILLFVTSLLIVMAIMTYGRIESYRYFSLTQAEFEKYMQVLERTYSNKSATNWYDSTVANKKGSTPTKNDTNDASKGSVPDTQPNKVSNLNDQNQNPNSPIGTSSSSRLNIKILLDATARTGNDKNYMQISQWTKNLMMVLYGNQQFFQDMLKKHPNLGDEIIENLYQTIQYMPEETRPQKANELANISLDKELEETYYRMLKGCPTLEKLAQPTSQLEKPVEFVVQDLQNQDDENDLVQESQEYSTGKGYSSLLNYITLSKAGKVRVYLASRELLLAIFGQPEVVENILSQRYSLYLQVRNGLSADDATKQFTSMFQNSIKDGDNSLLDFKVTKTNPSEYN